MLGDMPYLPLVCMLAISLLAQTPKTAPVLQIPAVAQGGPGFSADSPGINTKGKP